MNASNPTLLKTTSDDDDDEDDDDDDFHFRNFCDDDGFFLDLSRRYDRDGNYRR